MSTCSARLAREGPAIVDSEYLVFYRGWTSNSTKSQNTSRYAFQRQNGKTIRGYLCFRLLAVLVLRNTYNTRNADRLYFINTTVRITEVIHPAGILRQGFTCIARPGQQTIEYAYWYVNRFGYCMSIPIDTFDRCANLSIDTYCLD